MAQKVKKYIDNNTSPMIDTSLHPCYFYVKFFLKNVLIIIRPLMYSLLYCYS